MRICFDLSYYFVQDGQRYASAADEMQKPARKTDQIIAPWLPKQTAPKTEFQLLVFSLMQPSLWPASFEKRCSCHMMGFPGVSAGAKCLCVEQSLVPASIAEPTRARLKLAEFGPVQHMHC